MQFTHVSVIPILLSLTVIPACGTKKSKKRSASSPSARLEYFVHGNPTTLIQGSRQDTESFLDVTELEDFEDFSLAGYIVFTERSLKESWENWDDVEDANSTEWNDEELANEFEPTAFEFVQKEDGQWSYEDGEEDSLQLDFHEDNGYLTLSAYDGQPVEIQHYSLKEDGTAFSLLFTSTTPDNGRSLVSLSFASNDDPQPFTLEPKRYSYLFGSARIAWKDPINLQACGRFDAAHKAAIEGSVNAWLNDKERLNFTEGRPVAFDFTDAYAPFSDLNQQCIHLIRGFKAENTDNFFIAGMNLPSVNTASKSIIDSDIFLFMDHDEVSSGLLTAESKDLVHEIGHFLGLGHEFRQDSTGSVLHPSIMGYSQASGNITEWDFAAVRELYGAPLQPATER